MPPSVSALTALNLLLLLVLALLLFLPLLGVAVPLPLVASVLAVRLALRVYQGLQDPTLRRPAAWLLDAGLLVLLLMQNRPHP